MSGLSTAKKTEPFLVRSVDSGPGQRGPRQEPHRPHNRRSLLRIRRHAHGAKDQILEINPYADVYRYGRVGKVGYEIKFNRYFYKYEPPRPLEESEAVRRHADEMLVLAAFDLAHHAKQGLYDSLYLALTMKLNLPFLTADRKFYQALHHGEHRSRLLWIEDLP